MLALHVFQRLMPLILGLACAPLLMGVINKTKAFFAGRKGQPVLQMYYDLAKLLRKGAVYSQTTSWIFRFGSVVLLAVMVVVLALTPLPGFASLLAFEGDIVLILYLLALARFCLVVSALDTGSSFEGMGASREVCFATVAEPAMFIALMALSVKTGFFSLTGISTHIQPGSWHQAAPALVLVVVVLFVLLLVENARIPVDDPNTHLELTMIHEVMILDHGGPDLAIMLYGACLKLWFFSAVIVAILVPLLTDFLGVSILLTVVGMVVVAVLVGIVESSLARLKLLRVPQMIVGLSVLAGLGLLILLI